MYVISRPFLLNREVHAFIYLLDIAALDSYAIKQAFSLLKPFLQLLIAFWK